MSRRRSVLSDPRRSPVPLQAAKLRPVSECLYWSGYYLEHIASSEDHSRSLLLHAFDRHETHCRSSRRFTNSFGIGGIVLLALDERLRVRGAISLDLMAQPADLAPPKRKRQSRLPSPRWRDGCAVKTVSTGSRRLPNMTVPPASAPWA